LANVPFKPTFVAYAPEIGTYLPPNHPNNSNIQAKTKKSASDVLKRYILSKKWPNQSN